MRDEYSMKGKVSFGHTRKMFEIMERENRITEKELAIILCCGN